jgi:hypothetical protein
MIAATVLTLMGGGLCLNAGDFKMTPVKPQLLEAERRDVPDIWALDIKFNAVRYILVDTPDKGRKLYWYMSYVVTNKTGAGRKFIPQFELVTAAGKTFNDSIHPRAEAAIKAREEPTIPLYNSVTISSKDLEATPKEGAAREYRGVAIWPDMEPGDESVKAFTVYVYGLSNGYVKVEDENTKKPVLKRKVLRIDFDKPGDVLNRRESEIRLKDHSWTYR